MGQTAFIFPGQGAQSVGMGLDAYGEHGASRRIYDLADEVLGFKLTDIMFNGPEDRLKITYNTQPALLAVSIAYLEAFKETGLIPDYVAGHSLGEYSALVAAGSLSFKDAVKTVYSRGQFMNEAVPAGNGSMAAVLGMERDALIQLCSRISAEIGLVELANVNCPGQIVVSGSMKGVQAVVEHGKEAGAKRVIQLEVSGPFHSSMMKPASEQLSGVLSTIPILPAAIPLVANVTARPVSQPEEIRQLLIQQVYSPVLWEDSIQWLISQGVDTFVEIGAGNVLAGLIKKIDREVKIISVNSLSSIKGAAQV
ncbi:MAG TPA: ACP S-malonyltransferase [Bacilli bacterium]